MILAVVEDNGRKATEDNNEMKMRCDTASNFDREK